MTTRIATPLLIEYAHLREDVLRLGSLAELQCDWAVQALRDRDHGQARRVIENDTRANILRVKIERTGLELIATQHPAARDLRRVLASMHIASELERIADHASGIASVSLRIGDAPLPQGLDSIERMRSITVRMLHTSMDAFYRDDEALARHTMRQDDSVDVLYSENWARLMAQSSAQTHDVRGSTYGLWIARNLERIGDRVQNICERVLFVVTGDLDPGSERASAAARPGPR
jgi:phosphate transport system protein